MHIRAQVRNSQGRHEAQVSTNASSRTLDIPPKAGGPGSSVNGGELLFLALATCYCNDVYREAAHRGIAVERVEVGVEGEFGAEGEPARNVAYRAKVAARASEADILELMRAVDRVAEIQNTLRVETPVILAATEAQSLP